MCPFSNGRRTFRDTGRDLPVDFREATGWDRARSIWGYRGSVIKLVREFSLGLLGSAK